MARIARVTAEQAGGEVEQILLFTRSGLAEMTGREPENMLEPLELYAHIPGLLKGIGALAAASGQLHGISKRYHALASLKAATLTNCEYCIDIGSQVSRQWGLTDEELLALPFYRESPCFDEVDKLVLDYAVGMSRTPVEVSDEMVARLCEHFDDGQVLELTHAIALENMYGRFNLALGVGAAGFSEGMVCAIPERVA